VAIKSPTPFKLAKMTPEELAQARARLNMTQRQLAAAIGAEFGTVSRWERGTQPIRSQVAALVRSLVAQGVRGEGPAKRGRKPSKPKAA
jgi:DNA-binding transcriptional regulator YiaG